ncbi:hypothetical protein SAMN02745221_00744 [Thermosyntropha lipolytica DSM 11003]|uniref:Uncharacterized protein n=1 Tax=Thermosyntropha lipolytica DSM 11003 TaxID=1123382 RepID=A0A1M5LU20_9FIRM|nr:hypothetical protein [Thermosyntropha lipolytica]SHG68521.1 hypothetical protein SAMN02745221_00744 [Thermosyntropha lipolytica DSM 11003]
MKIRIKYCGGCNSGYDRVKFVKLIAKAYKDMKGEDLSLAYFDAEDIAAGLMVCGCSVCCPDREDIKDGLYPWYVITNSSFNYFSMDEAEVIKKVVDAISKGERR